MNFMMMKPWKKFKAISNKKKIQITTMCQLLGENLYRKYSGMKQLLILKSSSPVDYGYGLRVMTV